MTTPTSMIGVIAEEQSRPRMFGGPANQPWVDRYTSAHAGLGVAFAYYGLPLWSLVAAAVSWELVENVLKDKMPGLFPYSSHDSLGNSIVDTSAAIAAHVATRMSLDDPNVTQRTRGAVAAGAGAAVGGIIGSVAFGLVGKIAGTSEAGMTNRFGSIGYLAGAAAGAGIGLLGEDNTVSEIETAIAAGGGAVGGPLGAVLAAWAAHGR